METKDTADLMMKMIEINGKDFLGGALIGLAAAILLLFSGEIMGSSGIVNSLLLNGHPGGAMSKDIPRKEQNAQKLNWKLVFVVSFLIVAQATTYYHDTTTRSNSSIALTIKTAADQRSALAYALGGLLVGFGTKLGNGCTSGHGICGLGRLSRRSFAAVLVFMGVAIIATVLDLGNKILFLLPWSNATTSNIANSSTLLSGEQHFFSELYPYTSIGAGALVSLLTLIVLHPVASTCVRRSQITEKQGHSQFDEDSAKVIPGAVSGAVFAQGLFWSDMINPTVVMGFLNVANIPKGTWDSTLMAVMCGGVLVSLISYQLVSGYNVLLPASWCSVQLKKPVSLPEGCVFHIPTNTTIDYALIMGAACFGLGWSLVGLCPAPAIFSAALGIPQVLLLWWPAYYGGIQLGDRYKNRIAQQ